MSNIVHGKGKEPVASKTKISDVLSGPLKVVAKVELFANRCIHEGEEVKGSLSKLLELETVGIKEANPVNEDLIDNISFN